MRSGKALYVGISNYNAEQTRIAVKTLREMGTPMLIHQPKYSMLVRMPEQIEENVRAFANPVLSEEELNEIEQILI